jgi:hypothetical protein
MLRAPVWVAPEPIWFAFEIVLALGARRRPAL